MPAPFITAVMIHVQSVDEAMVWYERAFPEALQSSIAEEEFEFLLVGQVKLEFVLADQKVSSGPSGSVVYWQFPEFEEALVRFQAAGAKLYRGPMPIEGGQLMCQVQDPWSNCIGLRGPSSLSKSRSVAKQLPSPSIERTRPGKPGRVKR
jgi:predicted enzyme related to lactoylglutathione lyase